MAEAAALWQRVAALVAAHLQGGARSARENIDPAPPEEEEERGSPEVESGRGLGGVRMQRARQPVWARGASGWGIVWWRSAARLREVRGRRKSVQGACVRVCVCVCVCVCVLVLVLVWVCVCVCVCV